MRLSCKEIQTKLSLELFKNYRYRQKILKEIIDHKSNIVCCKNTSTPLFKKLFIIFVNVSLWAEKCSV